jgi:TPP-dependent trihydroxycyclohexane-1,2-dione (THcHDO) dehydratase
VYGYEIAADWYQTIKEDDGEVYVIQGDGGYFNDAY